LSWFFFAGYIVDCAFTVAFNPVFDPLLEASREATYTGIKVLNRKMLLCGWLVFIRVNRRALCYVDESAFLLISQNAQPKYHLLK
jgi:hypothetical protein